MAEFDMKNMNLMGIIALVGAIILIVGVFLGWISAKDVADAKVYSGWDIWNNVDGIQNTKSFIVFTITGIGYSYIPLVALICGIISLALMVLPTFVNTEKFEQINNILGLVALIMAAIVVVCGILFYLQNITVTGLGAGNYPLADYFNIGIGFWLVLVGGIITLVGGLMPILKNKGIINF